MRIKMNYVTTILSKLGAITSLNLILLILSFVLSAYSHANNPNKQLLTPLQVEQDIMLLKEAYERIHPGYTRYATLDELNLSWSKIIEQAKVNNGMTLADLYLNIQQGLSLIRCDHTKANLPKNIVSRRETEQVYLPFKWRWIENRAIITQVPVNSPFSVNDEVLSIDSKSITEIVKKVRHYTPVDGYTEWTKDAGLGVSYEFMGGAVDHFGDLLWNYKPQANITFVSSDTKIQSVITERVSHSEWLDIVNYKDKNGKALSNNFKDAVHFKLIDKNTALLRIDTFVNYRNTVEPNNIYEPIFREIMEKGINKLILDLRNNGGGSSDATLGLFSNLISKKTKFALDMRVNSLDHQDLTEYLWTWDKRALNPKRIGFSKNDDGTYSLRSFLSDELATIKPAKYAYSGKVIALTSNSNSSASTNLLSILHDQGRVTLIGENTGGSAQGPTAGILFTLRLPASKITSRIPFFRYTNNVENYEHGMGLQADVYAPMTVEALKKGQDPALEAALALKIK